MRGSRGRSAARPEPALNLDQSLRSHLVSRLHDFVAGIVAPQPTPTADQAQLAAAITREGHDLRITRELDVAKNYLRDRYADAPEARFGLVASSRDRDLVRFGVSNDYQATKRLR